MNRNSILPLKIAAGDEHAISRVSLMLLAGVAVVLIPLLNGEEKSILVDEPSDPEARAESLEAVQKVKEIVAAFFKLALRGNADEASKLAADPEKGFKHAEEIKNALMEAPIELTSVQLNAEENRAFAISKLVTLREADPDDRGVGVLTVSLVKSKKLTRRGWRIHDIDLESREDAQAESQKFLKAN